MPNALNNSIQGLNAAQRQLAVLSQNVANASTEGYTRKKLDQTSVYINGEGSGVQTGGLTRTVNSNLQYSLWAQNSTAESAATSYNYMGQLQELFGTPESNSSFAGALSDLKTAFISLDADPSNNVQQNQVLSDAQNLAGKFNTLSNNIQSLRNNAQSELVNSIGSVNQLLEKIASINVSISRSGAYNADTTGLQDERDLAINELSKYMNISSHTNSDGTVTVNMTDGTLLADTKAQTLSITNPPLTAQSYYPATAGTITLNGTDVTGKITSGSMGGLIKTRDTDLPKAQAMLDETAQKLAERFNKQNVKLFTDASGAVPANTPATGYVGFSGKIQVNTAIVNDPSLIQKGTAGGTFNASDNTNIENVLNYTFGNNSDAAGTPNTAFNTSSLGPGGNLSINMPSSGNIQNFANNVIANLSQKYSQIKTDNKYQSNYQQTLQKNMQDDSGVSIDKEMANMIILQNAYSANAKVMNTVSSMLKTLMDVI